MNKERIRIGEDTDLKSAGCESLGGSSPSLSAHCKVAKLGCLSYDLGIRTHSSRGQGTRNRKVIWGGPPACKHCVTFRISL